MKRWGKKKITIITVISVILYFIIGIIAPFLITKEVDNEFADSVKSEMFYSDDISVDRAMILETNQSAWDERLRMLDKAKEEIILSTFDMRDGESTKDILSVILAKANEGVKVKILVDGCNGAMRMNSNSIFKAVSSHPNIEIKMYNNINPLLPWKSQGRLHDKYVIVDDIGYILGGRNTFDYFIGEFKARSKSFDREILVYNNGNGKDETEESSLFQLKNYFNSVWESEESKLFFDDEELIEKESIKEKAEFLNARYKSLKEDWPNLFDEYSYEDHTVPTNKITLLSNDIHVYGKEPKVFYSLVQLMKGAEKQVVIHSPYAVFNDYMLNSLKEVGNTVDDFQLVINSVENGDNFFASSDYLRNKKKIIETGADIYEYDGGTSYHAKSLTIDDNMSIVGSFNFDLRSTYVDTELMLVVNSEELTSQLKSYMDGYEKDCRKVIDEKNYEVPEHLTVAKVGPVQKFLWWIVGLIMQPFRVLV